MGEAAVAGVKDRETDQVDAEVVWSTNKETLQGLVERKTDAEAIVYTDKHAAYWGPPRHHEAVGHSVVNSSIMWPIPTGLNPSGRCSSVGT